MKLNRCNPLISFIWITILHHVSCYRPGYNTRRIQGFSIRLSNTTQTDRQNICYQDDGKTTLPPIIEQQCKGVAKFVWIYTNKMFSYGAVLEVCEVQVYGCSYQGSDGNCISCDQCKNDCNINGECDEQGCKCENSLPPLCKVCYTGFYGKGCQEKCGQCDNEQCNHINGSCSGQCKPGFQGDKCDRACNPNWYGRECKEKCGFCRHKNQCHHVTGSCSGLCDSGYSGDKCAFSEHLANQREIIKLMRDLLAYKRRKSELKENGTSPTDLK